MKRYTLKEWYEHNKLQYAASDRYNHFASQLLVEGDRIRENAKEVTELNKQETEAKLQERKIDIEFRRDEIEKERKKVYLEIEALVALRDRLKNALTAYKERGLDISRQCIVIREKRQGVDLVHDRVEKELLMEERRTVEVLELLETVHDQVVEQLREMRSVQYYLDKDQRDKDDALNTEKQNLAMKETYSTIHICEGKSNLDIAEISFDEWVEHTAIGLERGQKQRFITNKLKSYADLMLKKTSEDLWRQYRATNEAFQHRISEVREAKDKLEARLKETVQKGIEMENNMSELQQAIDDKEKYLALAHTRLSNRKTRPRVELTRDIVEHDLVREVLDIKENVANMQRILAESQASHRWLTSCQVAIEVDLNNKLNSLKLDEVDCMTLRENIVYNPY